MPNRPDIPAEVKREVFIEAGHRCAVCGEVSPLELAHIVAWSRSRDHSAHNLICMCAGCHQRADIERWGTKTLRTYKEKPWIRNANIVIGPAGSESLRPLHQIPPPPTDFTDREAELGELREATNTGKTTVLGVRGMGGVGKTALALKFAEELVSDQFDAEIYLDLNGLRQGGKEPLTAAQ